MSRLGMNQERTLPRVVTEPLRDRACKCVGRPQRVCRSCHEYQLGSRALYLNVRPGCYLRIRAQASLVILAILDQTLVGLFPPGEIVGYNGTPLPPNVQDGRPSNPVPAQATEDGDNAKTARGRLSCTATKSAASAPRDRPSSATREQPLDSSRSMPSMNSSSGTSRIASGSPGWPNHRCARAIAPARASS